VNTAEAHVSTPMAWWQTESTRIKTAASASEDGSRVAFIALVAFTFILLLSPQAWFPVLKTVRIAFLAATLAIAVHVVERTLHRKPVTPFSTEIGIVLALVGWALLTIPLSYWPGGSVRLLTDNYLKAVAFFWLLGTMITTTKQLRILAWSLLLCSIPLAATGLKNYLVGDVLSTRVPGLVRIYGYVGGSGLTANPNDLALMLNLILPITGALVLMTRGARRALAAFALLLSIAAIVVTFSRAGFLTLVASFLMFLAVLARQKSSGVAIGLLLLALCVPPLLPSGYIDRLSTIADIDADRTGSAKGRWRDTGYAIEVVAHNPIIGVGIGQDLIAMNAERGRDTWRRVHNAYLQYAVDLGIPGALLFIWLHLTCYKSARAVEKRAAKDPALRDLRQLAAGVQIGLVAFAVAAMFHPIAYQFYFFSIGGLAVALKNTCRAEIAKAQLAPGATS